MIKTKHKFVHCFHVKLLSVDLLFAKDSAAENMSFLKILVLFQKHIKQLYI